MNGHLQSLGKRARRRSLLLLELADGAAFATKDAKQLAIVESMAGGRIREVCNGKIVVAKRCSKAVLLMAVEVVADEVEVVIEVVTVEVVVEQAVVVRSCGHKRLRS